MINGYVGNVPPMPGVFPDYPAPAVRTDGTGGPPVTNIRNTSSPHWRGWLKPENRCLVPANSFAEYALEPNPDAGKKDVVWLALNDGRPLFAFGGMWSKQRGERGTKSKPIPGPHLIYGFVTTVPNAVVAPIHPKAMPVISRPKMNAMSGCARRGMKRRHCNARCPLKRSRSWHAGTRKRISRRSTDKWASGRR